MAGVAIDSIYDMRSALRRHPARPDVGVDDHERRGAAGHGALHRGRRGAGRPARAAGGHHPERHPQGVHGPQHLHLPARPRPCGSSPTSSATPPSTCRGSTRISISGYHMQEAGATADLELAYTLADGVEYVRAGLDAGPRHRRLRPPAVLLLGHRHELLHGGGQDARRPPLWAKLVRAVRADERQVACRCAPTARRRAGRSPRRTCSTTSCAPASRPWPPPRATPSSLHTNALDEAIALPTDFSARIARNTQLFLQQETGTRRTHRPLGRQLLRRGADPRAGRAGLGPHPGGRGSWAA